MPKNRGLCSFYFNQKKKPFISDQEQVAKELISNDTRIIYMTINGDFPIHFATKQSALEKSQNSASN